MHVYDREVSGLLPRSAGAAPSHPHLSLAEVHHSIYLADVYHTISLAEAQDSIKEAVCSFMKAARAKA
jgi:hypothetical protein